MFGWLFGKKKISEEQEKDLALLQDQIITSLEIALADANARALQNFERGRETIACCLMANNGEVLVTKEILEVVRTSHFNINLENKPDDSILLSIVPVEPESDSEKPKESK